MPVFSQQEELNLWVEKETKGLIKNLLSPGSVLSLTRLIFGNALYFKGAWEEEFDISDTKDYDFYLHNGDSVSHSKKHKKNNKKKIGNSVNVPFMSSSNDQFISVFDGFKVLRLPYKQGKDKRQFSIYIFLPDTKDGLLALIEKIASESDFLEEKLPREKVKVGAFRIPKFNISFQFEASEMLKELGVVLPFCAGHLTKMVDSSMDEHLFVSNIFHKSVIEVNEEGTEAAAATFCEMECFGCFLDDDAPPLVEFVADHPFLFLIREDLSGTILFVGQVLNPLVM